MAAAGGLERTCWPNMAKTAIPVRSCETSQQDALDHTLCGRPHPILLIEDLAPDSLVLIRVRKLQALQLHLDLFR